MQKLLQIKQLGQLKTIFVFGNYPISDKDAQQFVDQGITDPKEIRQKLHELGLKRMIGEI